MSKIPWTLFLWPGLPRLWLRGSWFSLLVAAAAGAALSAALVLSFGWSELITPGVRTALWGSLGAGWCLAAAVALARRRRWLPAEETMVSEDDRFPAALENYLRGDWFEAERVLAEVLEYNPRDIEARLLLATMLRHLRRGDEAARHLDLLVRLDGAEKWEFEIRRERKQLDATRVAAASTAAFSPAACGRREDVNNVAVRNNAGHKCPG
ncbi:MAG: hypothetical protein JXB10_16805 [Pirellulales bacterium]|nr:hypothetical protein [Pirellulales bacterium]